MVKDILLTVQNHMPSWIKRVPVNRYSGKQESWATAKFSGAVSKLSNQPWLEIVARECYNNESGRTVEKCVMITFNESQMIALRDLINSVLNENT